MSEAHTDRLNAALEGRYRIVRQLGEGGMAVVYLADDLRHDRKVALKVLKPELAAVVGAERFLAEIKTTAGLQHPHILPLFDSGEAAGFLFYVMPYVEGESLRARLDREHQLPVDETVRIAMDVADALDYAHHRGVIHRDIKPANILLHAGKPLVADFGIALAVGMGGAERLTETGLSVGTPHYMSPEQATGDMSVGPATDVYALGCVVYEMLVGEPPYTGSTPQAILGKVIAGERASARKHRASVPPQVDAAIVTALERVPADRFSSGSALRAALADPTFRRPGDDDGGAVTGPGWWKAFSAGAVAAALLAALVGALVLVGGDATRPVVRLELGFGPGQEPYSDGLLTFAPNGALVYANSEGIWLRTWDDLDARLVPGTTGAQTFAISPDGVEVAYSSFPGALRAVSIGGGPVRELTPVALGVWSWTPDGYLYFTGPDRVLSRLRPDDASGAPETLTELADGDFAHGFASVLPGGRRVLFQVQRVPEAGRAAAETWVLDLATRERTYVTDGGGPRYVDTGHLLFGSNQGLAVAPFDPDRGELVGPAVQVANVVPSSLGVSPYAVSRDGTLVYARPPGDSELLWTPAWVSRTGEVTSIDADFAFAVPPTFFGWTLSPRGDRIAMSRRVGTDVDVWIKTLPAGPTERLTLDPREDNAAAWTPDGLSVAFVRSEGGRSAVLRQRADGASEPVVILDSVPMALMQTRWSPDGSWLLFQGLRFEGQGPFRDVVGLRPGVDSAVVPLLAEARFDELGPAVSPDGRWLAYSSNETGAQEVYVRPFPTVTESRVRVSTDGGWSPRWSPDGGELFYIAPGAHMIAARIAAGSELRVAARDTLFAFGPAHDELPAAPGSGEFDVYDVSPDGQRFLMALPAAGRFPESTTYVLVQNFFEELR